MTRRWLAALGIVALVMSMASVAHAAELDLSPPATRSLAVAEKCAQAEVKVAGTEGDRALTVSNLPAACGGLPLAVWLHGDRGPTHTFATAPQGGGAVTVTVPGSVNTRTKALATIATWPMPTRTDIAVLPFVSCRTPHSDAGCTVAVTETPAGHGRWIRIVHVSTDSLTPVEWELVFNLSSAANPVRPTNYLEHKWGLAQPEDPSASCAIEPRVVVAHGHNNAGNVTLTKLQSPYRFEVEGSDTVNEWAPAHSILLACP